MTTLQRALGRELFDGSRVVDGVLGELVWITGQFGGASGRFISPRSDA